MDMLNVNCNGMVDGNNYMVELCQGCTSSSYEPSRGKTNNVVSEQVQHKPACTSTEKR